jgi:hypothetical protein
MEDINERNTGTALLDEPASSSSTSSPGLDTGGETVLRQPKGNKKKIALASAAAVAGVAAAAGLAALRKRSAGAANVTATAGETQGLDLSPKQIEKRAKKAEKERKKEAKKAKKDH